MAAIAKAQVQLIRGSDHFVGGLEPRTRIQRRLLLNAVTAADTATPAVLGLSSITAAHSAVVSGSPAVPVLVGIDTVNNLLVLGTGPNNSTVQVTVEGAPTIVGGY